MKPIVVEIDRHDCARLSCPYGVVDVPPSAIHDRGWGRCVHLLADRMPRCTLFARKFVAGLNFQPVTYGLSTPVIASRRGDVVMLAFDVLDTPIERCRCTTNRRIDDEHRWYYRVHEMRWFDEPDIAADLLLGVWAD